MTDALTRHLTEGIRLVDALVKALEAEADALIQRDPVALEAVLDDKREHLSGLQAWDQTWRTACARIGIDPDAPDLPDTLQNRCPELTELWRSFTDRLAHCRDTNATNGALVQRNRQRTDRLRTLLTTSLQGNDSAPLYGPGGTLTYADPNPTPGTRA